ncbi:MAG: hypothetical protein B0D96_05250 [Candidatus Sedimenticola endophacoides]|nr:MAG: hypothetical protein B0D94_12140 [Candidatus Sedimenticola endophacoides]OQX36040.1 MAG: hypothetical protein B0D96_05250 [Candidatus Sedimenticola endophacoides]OQX39450.1 MAG: hypothetical protein B0D88_09415 [Candidatus Sedimenticola endophacoides]OQX40864.1 MAG: hypothetical protein B0D89_06230 [Candidatus Sedimenticola endophacoides]OQX44480.1 MAG: hypothetical protein B0D85_06865 [Candidatus Sedimenticola endophacoides]
MGDLRSIIRRIHLFADLDEGDQARLEEGARHLKLKKGASLFHCGDEADGFYYVIQGCVKLTLFAPGGGEKVVEIIREGMTFGEAVMFAGKPYPVTSQAVSETHLLFLSRDPVLRCIEQRPGFALRMLTGISRRMHGLVHDIETYSLCSALQRVVGYLLNEIEPEGAHESICALRLPTNKSVLASRLNLTPETLSRVLRNLSEKSLIEVSGRQVVIRDIRRFVQFAEQSGRLL